MTIPYRVTIGRALSSKERQSLRQSILTIFHRIDYIYNNWNPDSELSRINRAPAQIPLPVSHELFAFLVRINSIHQETERRFDPTLGPLKILWLSHLKRGTIPSEDELTQCPVGWSYLHLDPHHQTITKLHPGIQLDLCGTVKGYAVDELLDACRNFSPNCYVEWGGEIKTSGEHPDQRPWRIFSSASNSLIDLNNEAIATSGTEYQKWYVNGVWYSHILDPITKYPLQAHSLGLSTISVIHPNCAYADAIATALMTFPSKQDAERWAEEHNLTMYAKSPEGWGYSTTP